MSDADKTVRRPRCSDLSSTVATPEWFMCTNGISALACGRWNLRGRLALRLREVCHAHYRPGPDAAPSRAVDGTPARGRDPDRSDGRYSRRQCGGAENAWDRQGRGSPGRLPTTMRSVFCLRYRDHRQADAPRLSVGPSPCGRKLSRPDRGGGTARLQHAALGPSGARRRHGCAPHLGLGATHHPHIHSRSCRVARLSRSTARTLDLGTTRVPPAGSGCSARCSAAPVPDST